jgi:dTDP-4-dehydrorhamnose 3,5-epimerase
LVSNKDDEDTNMKFEASGIAGLWRLIMERHPDERGSFGRMFCRDTFASYGLASDFVQMNLSQTHRAGTLRGMHLQHPPHAETKLVRCIRGAVHDIVCDLRPNSVTRGQHRAYRLEENDDTLLHIPPGCAHGFQALTDDVEVFYAMSERFAPQASAGLRYDDSALNLVWPLPVICVSERDLLWPAYDSAVFHDC